MPKNQPNQNPLPKGQSERTYKDMNRDLSSAISQLPGHPHVDDEFIHHLNQDILREAKSEARKTDRIEDQSTDTRLRRHDQIQKQKTALARDFAVHEQRLAEAREVYKNQTVNQLKAQQEAQQKQAQAQQEAQQKQAQARQKSQNKKQKSALSSAKDLSSPSSAAKKLSKAIPVVGGIIGTGIGAIIFIDQFS